MAIAMISRKRTSILLGVLLLAGTAAAVYFGTRNRSAPDQPVTVGPAPYQAPLVISVSTVYSGANAQTVAETLAEPIEQQVNGVEHMLAMTSHSASDGSYTLNITFAPGTDLDLAQMLVQNRVSLALPAVPAAVQQAGIAVRKRSLQPLMLVSLTAPGNRYDELYLSNYATIQIKDELARVPGVADITMFGQRDYQMRVMLDPDRLAARELTVTDVATAISRQNISVSGPIGDGTAPKGQAIQLSLTTLGRLADPEQFENIIVKAAAGGATVRLKDVAQVEVASNASGVKSASFNGRPAVLLSIDPLPNSKPGEVSHAIADKLAELRSALPDGLKLEVVFDFTPNLVQPNEPTTPEYLVIDATLPEAASAERTAKTLEQATELVRKTPGVEDVLTLSEHPFSPVRDRPCLVVRLTPRAQRQLDRQQLAADLTIALKTQIPDVAFRISASTTAEGLPLYGFPIDFAIEDRGQNGIEALLGGAEGLVEKLKHSGKFSDVDVDSGLRRIPLLTLEVDRAKCLALGVDVDDIFKTVQTFLGSATVNKFNQAGRTWQVTLQAQSRRLDRTADIKKLQVKNKDKQLVPLGAVVNLRETSAPSVLERHNMYPVARITANLAAGVPLADAKALCETVAGESAAAKQFKLVWRGH
jgi:multidrug efflux pump subunit AcrB